MKGAGDVQRFIFERHGDVFSAMGLDQASLPDDFDLTLSGVVDSFGMLELIADLEETFEVELDLEGLAADDLTLVGPLSRYVADSVRSASKT